MGVTGLSLFRARAICSRSSLSVGSTVRRGKVEEGMFEEVATSIREVTELSGACDATSDTVSSRFVTLAGC